MHTAQLVFRARNATNGEELFAAVQGYLATLLQNGQILGDHTPMAVIRGGYLVTASLPESDALVDRFSNKWVRRRRRALAALGVDQPKVTHLGTDPEGGAPCRCRKRPFLILFTTFMNPEPPLRCGACFGPVPLYKVPATNEVGNYENILAWQDIYRAMDWLFIATGPGERFAHDQLSRVDSRLSRNGRELARTLEKKVRIPVYYYLYKHFGRSDRVERQRRCPSCGKAWLRNQPLHRIFDFQCRRCRLLSNVAFDVRLDAPSAPTVTPAAAPRSVARAARGGPVRRMPARRPPP
jgi:predicted  nucleic acid-binding Zn ribbon protein